METKEVKPKPKGTRRDRYRKVASGILSVGGFFAGSVAGSLLTDPEAVRQLTAILTGAVGLLAWWIKTHHK